MRLQALVQPQSWCDAVTTRTPVEAAMVELWVAEKME